MTIGSTYNYPAHTAASPNTPPASAWAAPYPNPPDLCFDYRKLLEQPGGIATSGAQQARICIVGAGVTGLTAARELLRCGFSEITLIEQASRVGGRHLTLTSRSSASTLPSTPFEMGAMRMPLFNKSGQPPKEGRSLMAYYAALFELRLSDFPNPGTPWVASTGIYLREGQLDTQAEPSLLIWQNPEGLTPPPTEALAGVYAKWHEFAKRMVDQVALVYGTSQWPAFWAAMVQRYQDMSFRELVAAPAIEQWHAEAPGDFGGLGMNAQESAIFYAIGIGDGSWGAFYDVCCLYPLRTAIFGFSSHLQLVHGRVDAMGQPLPAPYLGAAAVLDCQGNAFETPGYLGLVALDQALLFMPIDGVGRSFYEHSLERNDGFFTSTSVTGLTKLDNGQIRVHYQSNPPGPPATMSSSGDFDAVIMTLPSWIIETRLRLEGFTEAMLPSTVINAYKTAHWETSCKVYAPLKKSFLDKNRRIPQILVTDSFVHDVYAYRYNAHYAYDCILLSYTWEDDATKLAGFSERDLVQRCANELDRILLRCHNVQAAISPHLDLENARVQRWSTDPNALGCARLYRAGTYDDAVSLLRYNRDYGAACGLYFAGEAYSVDAGWTEPALRGAIDAVIHLCARHGAAFNGGFSLADYPRYLHSR